MWRVLCYDKSKFLLTKKFKKLAGKLKKNYFIDRINIGPSKSYFIRLFYVFMLQQTFNKQKRTNSQENLQTKSMCYS